MRSRIMMAPMIVALFYNLWQNTTAGRPWMNASPERSGGDFKEPRASLGLPPAKRNASPESGEYHGRKRMVLYSFTRYDTMGL